MATRAEKTYLKIGKDQLSLLPLASYNTMNAKSYIKIIAY